MYAVFLREEKKVAYFGNDMEEALSVLNTNSKYTLKEFSDSKKLEDFLFGEKCCNDSCTAEETRACCGEETTTNQTSKEEEFSKTLDNLMNDLENLGLNEEFFDKFHSKIEEIQSEGLKLTSEVKHLGIKTMRAVGEKFIAIGDVLKSFSEEKK